MDDLFPRLRRADAAPAVSVGDTTLTYRELAAACDRRIRDLRASLRPGHRVAIATHPTLDTVVDLVANAIYGAVSVPLNPRLGTTERAHILDDARPWPHDDHRAGPPGAALILYTSGTTGPPKGAIITRANIATNLDALASVWQWTPADTLVHALPLFHVHGLVLGLFGTLRVGAHLRWLPKFSPDALTDAVANATMLFAVPTMYRRLSHTPALARARLLVSGSAALPVTEHQRLGLPIYERYGLTETLINCAVPLTAPPRPGYVGPPLPGIELRLVDEHRNTIKADDDTTLGEVAVRGPNVFAGYLNRPDATAAVLDADGWFYTGDLATRTPDNILRIHGRQSTDLIKTGGYKVGAGEIEACLLQAPGVTEAAVIGLPDDDLGQRITAYVVATNQTESTLIDFVSTHLSPHKRPRTIHFLKSLPRTPIGKIQKPKLPKP